MEISEEQKLRVFRQVREVFSDVDVDNLRLVCEQNHWITNKCIDAMLAGSAPQPSSSTISNATPSIRAFKIPKFAKPNRTQDAGMVKEHRIGELIKAGYRVMILMRGAPGSGKSYLARKILDQNLLPWTNYSYKDFILSADDYFLDKYGNYIYNVNRLTDAHAFNHKQALMKAAAGWSPIIIDNTNLQLWEMVPYVRCALEYGYLIEILEPRTPWCSSAGKLAMKNSHNVPKDKIQRMLDRYEKGTVEDLMKMVNEKKYSMPVPQMRSFPPITDIANKFEQPAIKEGARETIDEYETFATVPPANKANTLESTPPDDSFGDWPSPPKKPQGAFEWDSYERDAAKPQRKNNRYQKMGEEPISWQPTTSSHLTTTKESTTACQPTTSYQSTASSTSMTSSHQNDTWYSTSSFQPMISFQPIPSLQATDRSVEKRAVDSHTDALDQEIALFYRSINSESPNAESKPVIDNPGSASKTQKSLLDLLREDMPETQTPIKTDNSFSRRETFIRHSINCPNENTNFIILRQMYPNKSINALWDLFSTCNGDIGWAVDILLRENDMDIGNSDDDVVIDSFQCNCGKTEWEQMPSVEATLPTNLPSASTPKSPISRKRGVRSHKQVCEEAQEIRRDLESRFVIGDEHYSEHTRKIRDIRNGVFELGAGMEKITVDSAMQTMDLDGFSNGEDVGDDDDYDNDSGEDQELLEMTLGDNLVDQLHNVFKKEIALGEALPPNKNNKVFIPRKLAKELYMLWAESAYNEMEERRHELMREDEQFARLLKNPKYTHLSQSPCNVQQILDWEMAVDLQNKEQESQPSDEQRNAPPHLAAHLRQMKLVESFPTVPRDTLLDILSAHDYKFDEAVELVRSNIGGDEVVVQNEEIKTPEKPKEVKPSPSRVQQLISFNSIESLTLDHEQVYANLTLEEAKHLALRKFEEARNEAAHHCQMKAECYLKSQKAIQKGNSGVGLYYSQVAGMHKDKIEHFNHLAASFIMDAHKFSQNNPDLLDLHYLFVPEAISCVDLFLDRHITALRNGMNLQKHKHIFIITGRGLHSTGGVASIKNRVKGRLKDRGLRWCEVNPGLLKVKVFSASRHSKYIE